MTSSVAHEDHQVCHCICAHGLRGQMQHARLHEIATEERKKNQKYKKVTVSTIVKTKERISYFTIGDSYYVEL